MADLVENLETYLKREISKSGFPLEIKSALILEKHGWWTNPHIIYYNKERECNSEIDLTALRRTKRTGLGTTLDFLVIECKKQERKPWVFFQGDKPNTKVTTVIASPRQAIYRWLIRNFKNHYYYNQKPCKFHFPSFVESGKPDVILDAINQVIDALVFTFGQGMGGIIPSFYYPVIVLDGRLFSAQIDIDGSIAVSEADYLQLWVNRALIEPETTELGNSHGMASYTKDFIIDIVRLDVLEKFLKGSFQS